MALLESIRGPEDVRRLTRDQLQPLADEVRRRLIDVVSQTGGHIGAGLGVVELTVALGYCFDSPRDKIVWDVGHQGYPWKILTGRNDRLPTLRQAGGLSGFLRRSESSHDQFGAGHAGTGLSAAYGIAAARDLAGEQFKVVAVVGDGALTCGLPYEAMNNAGHSGRDIIMVLNDNGMSIAPNVGAINKYLGSIIASPITVRIRERVKALIESVSHIVGGQKLVDFAKTMEESIKNFWSPGMLFEELGFRYFGPIDGHNIAQMVQPSEIVKTLRGPRVVHVIPERGKGFPLPARDTEKSHARAPYDPVTGELRPVKAGPPQWTTVFGEALTQLAGEYPKLVAITAAMPSGTGTGIFQKKWPDRFFDVGIAEAHATTFAGGLATQGIRPVVAIYSTFLQRAYDSIIHDIAIQQLPVIFCLDRAGMVKAENHGQLLDRDVVDDAIVGALQERRVDRDHRPDALRGEAPGERRGVRLGDADVEETVGPLLLENAGPGPRRHGRGDRHKLGVFPRELGDGLPEHRSPLGRTRLDRSQLTRDRVVGCTRVVLLGVRRRQGEALPLLGDHMDDARSLERLHDLERLHQLRDVVTIDRPEVAEPELFEQHAGRPEVLDALLHRLGEVDELLTADDVGDGLDQRLDALPDPHGNRTRDDGAEVLVDGADVGGDRHAVVVQHHDDVAAGMARIVHRLVGEAARERTVSHDGDHLELLAGEIACRGDAVRRREAGPGVPGPELVVRTLAAPQEPGQATRLAQRRQAIVPAGEDLPGGALMAHVPHFPGWGRETLRGPAPPGVGEPTPACRKRSTARAASRSASARAAPTPSRVTKVDLANTASFPAVLPS